MYFFFTILYYFCTSLHRRFEEPKDYENSCCKDTGKMASFIQSFSCVKSGSLLCFVLQIKVRKINTELNYHETSILNLFKLTPLKSI